jgi:hypothetical protein
MRISWVRQQYLLVDGAVAVLVEEVERPLEAGQLLLLQLEHQ